MSVIDERMGTINLTTLNSELVQYSVLLSYCVGSFACLDNLCYALESGGRFNFMLDGIRNV